MENKQKLVATLITLNVSMAATLFALRAFNDETRLAVVNLIPLLFSAILGAGLSFLFYLSVKNILHKHLIKSPFLASFFPALSLMLVVIMTGAATYWLIDDLLLMLSFMMSLQQIAKGFDVEFSSVHTQEVSK
ncbi:hypothetical protein HII17_09745 [Thalassotalea sp. M1531]|uniref:Uncharacterized protein n=1 Tax=Thalassotalea algicola TaxID=2716224 RepID=A0A7Y0Q7G0_9GAMM|nr:hypothetical protein [Thalassotalea algicola]NMP31847.1 hypothetical protein [Thalassotalea algicola]